MKQFRGHLLVLAVPAIILLSLIIPEGSTASGERHDVASPNAVVPATFSCDAVSEIPKAECEALVALYTSTNGPGWTNKTGWLETDTPCSWFGVTCASGHVQQLILTSNQLSGPILPQLGDLTGLGWLRLGDNQLTGRIPEELGRLTNLFDLLLYSNQLSGEIPSELGNLSSLRRFSAFSNQLSGSIPPELGNLQHLWYLWLNRNQLGGNIPWQLGNLTALRELSLSSNRLIGRIPAELGNLVNIQYLCLADNWLSGAIPPELGSLANVMFLGLGSNQLSGSIPPTLGNLINTQNLYLANTALDGTIPSELGNLMNLNQLNLSNTRVSGMIPSELSHLVSLKRLYLDNTRLSGAVPTSLAGLQLEYFWFDSTDLCEPPDPGFLTWLAGIVNLQRTDVRCGARTVHGIVWNDLNQDGVQARGEPPISGVTVSLTRDGGALAATAAGRQVVTGSDGSYLFANVAAGAYLIAIMPSDTLPTVPRPISIIVQEDADVTVPPIGLTGVPVRLFLPLILR